MTQRIARAALSSMLLATVLAAPAAAQHIPPHSNDPHPPANQPTYQLPSPLSRPGVPGFPGAAHSNDPHFRKTEPSIVWPRATPPQYSPNPTRESLRQYQSTTPRDVIERRRQAREARRGQSRGQGREARPVERTISLEQCYRNWDRNTGMSRASWQSTCRRLAVSGRVGVW